ncbi:MAG: PAS domain S-box protein [Nitrospirae bacterium]|nr:PAS domain S-box protein [Nitrospirota bacterium]
MNDNKGLQSDGSVPDVLTSQAGGGNATYAGALCRLMSENLWHTLWVAFILAEILAALTNTVMSYVWWGRFSLDLVLIGSVDVLVVAPIVASVIVLLIATVRKGDQAMFETATMEVSELERRVEERTEKLRESEARYRTLMEQASDAIVIHDRHAKIVEVNTRACELSGYTPDELIGMSIAELTPSDMHDLVSEGMRIVLEGNTFTGSVDTIRKDGVRIPSDISSRMLEDGRIMAIVRDATERRRTEDALRESEARFRSLVERNHVGVYILIDGCIVYANPRLAEIFACTQDELIGVNVLQLIHPEDQQKAVERMQAMIAGGSPGEDEGLRTFTKDGRMIYIHVMGTPHVYEGKPAIFGTLMDITARKLAEDAREQMRDQLFHSRKMEAVGTLAGGIAHDFNNLLTVIKGESEQAMEDIGEGSTTYMNLRQINVAAERAANLTRKLLLFSRQKPGAPVPMDLNRTLDEFMGMLRRLIGEDVVVRMELGHEVMAVRADPGNLEQVAMNLAVNARDAMPGGGTLSFRTEKAEFDEEACKPVPGARPGRFVCMTVSDTGVGMDSETLRHIFDPFYSTKDEKKGTGLGLSVVYGIVEEQGGWINVFSEPGRGTTFKVYLKACDDRPEDFHATAETRTKRPCGKGEKVLLVEDEEGVVMLITKVLSRQGYTVYVAETAKEALDTFEREGGEFHLVFSDVVLPDMSGIDMVKKMMERQPGIRVLLSSGYTDHKSQWPLIQEMGLNFIEKPYDLPDLLEAVRDAMGPCE